ncbi:MAG TPA: HD domain-containing phosphohydrolase [Synergistaceae bacterium]|nr:HD domain-containing phosphohydrolase [Synergistaceae bacterium]HPQ36378.1 HD domain-containing phosphohydrolase [Synergistaceae bacterium]
MLLINTLHLEENMVLAQAILNPNGAVLLGEGALLTPSRIRRIQEMGVQHVYVEDSRFPDISSNWVIREEIYRKSMKELDTLFGTIADDAKEYVLLADMREIHGIFRHILSDIFSLSGKTLVHFINSRSVQNNLFEHSVHVALLSLVMGKRFNLAYMQMYNLGLGALLHDIGKAVLPREILDSNHRLVPEEEELYRMHPRTGWELLSGQECIWPTARIIALQHHELWDGSGYPSNLSRHNIHLFSHIVCIANTYDNMIHSSREWPNPCLPNHAYEHIEKNRGILYDPQMVSVFSRSVAKYPVGTWLRLSTGHTGMVISVDEYTGLPKIRCFSHLNFGTLKNSVEIDLRETPVEIMEVFLEEPESEMQRNERE